MRCFINAAGAAALLLAGASPAWSAVEQTIFSWENTTHDFRVGQLAESPFISVQNTDPLGITDGDYSAEVATVATTTFARGAFSSDVADALQGNSVLKVDFAVKDPDLVATYKNVYFSIIVAGRNESSGGPLVTVELPLEERIRAQDGTAVIDYGALSSDLTDGMLEARIEFRMTRQGGFAGSVFFDNLRVEVVPEPASLALIPMAGLLLARRRR